MPVLYTSVTTPNFSNSAWTAYDKMNVCQEDEARAAHDTTFLYLLLIKYLEPAVLEVLVDAVDK